MHRILAVGEIHWLGYVKPQHSNEGLKNLYTNSRTEINENVMKLWLSLPGQ
jgi:hypothetical protein